MNFLNKPKKNKDFKVTKTRKVVPKKGKIRVRQKQMCSFLEINLILKPF